MKFPSGKDYKTSQNISQHWSRWWFVAVRQQSINLLNAVQHLYRHMATLNHNELTYEIYQPHDCLFNRLFRRRSKKKLKFRVTGLCAGNSPGTGEFPAQMTSYAENVSIWWCHHWNSAKSRCYLKCSPYVQCIDLDMSKSFTKYISRNM